MRGGLEVAGGLLVCLWVLVALGAWIRSRLDPAPSGHGIFADVPWPAWACGAAGSALLWWVHRGPDATTWLVLGMAMLLFGAISFAAWLASRRGPAPVAGADAIIGDPRIQGLIDTLEGRRQPALDDQYARHAAIARIGGAVAAVFTVLFLAMLAWVSTLHSEMGFGGIVFLLGLGLLAVIALCGAWVTLAALVAMARLRRRIRRDEEGVTTEG